MKKKGYNQGIIVSHGNIGESLNDDVRIHNAKLCMLQKSTLGFKPMLLILVIAAAASGMTERKDTLHGKRKSDEGTVAVENKHVCLDDPKYLKFRIHDGVFESTSTDKLRECFREILHPKLGDVFGEKIYIMTIVNFELEKFTSAENFLQDICDLFENSSRIMSMNHYIGHLGLGVSTLSRASNTDFSMVFEGFEELRLVYNKFHELMINKLHVIAYDLTKRELINQLQTAMQRELMDHYKKPKNEEELKSAAVMFVKKFFLDVKTADPSDELFTKKSLHRYITCKVDESIESDTKKYARSIGAEQLNDKIIYYKLFDHLANTRYKDEIKKYIKLLISKLLPVIENEEYKTELITYYTEVCGAILQKANSKEPKKFEELVEDYLTEYNDQYQNANLEEKLRKELDTIIANLNEFFAQQRAVLLPQPKIKNITRIFSFCRNEIECNNKQLGRILLNPKVFAESTMEQNASNNEARDGSQSNVGGRTEESKYYWTIYGVINMHPNGHETNNLPTDAKRLKKERCT